MLRPSRTGRRSREKERGKGSEDVSRVVTAGHGPRRGLLRQRSPSASWWHDLWGGQAGNPRVRAPPRPDGRRAGEEKGVTRGRWRSPCSTWRGAGLDGRRPAECTAPRAPQRSPLPRPAIWATVLKTRRSALQEVRPGESCPAVGCSWRGSFPGFLCNHTEETVSTCTSSIL